MSMDGVSYITNSATATALLPCLYDIHLFAASPFVSEMVILENEGSAAPMHIDVSSPPVNNSLLRVLFQPGRSLLSEGMGSVGRPAPERELSKELNESDLEQQFLGANDIRTIAKTHVVRMRSAIAVDRAESYTWIPCT
ncbi:unnamed protein product [Arabis nemorensis]|uniref:Uncharacterized protein n=1 Tax=Arabis nemorensis TaxID=586526 RepID=A0A565AX22_9BRAS|nr:unnamed protein product [Arabis nemorensis]